MAADGTNSGGGSGGSSGGGGGSRRGGGGGQRRGGGGGSGGGRPGGNRGGGSGGGRPGGGRGRGPGGGSGSQAGQQHATPIEAAARSTRNALKRQAESLRDEQSRLACRSILMSIVSATGGAVSPGEILGVVEQVVHVHESGNRDAASLPVTLRAVIAFAGEDPRRGKDVAEMLRLLLRHAYCLGADHIPRLLRDDGGFRATALQTVLEEVAREYMDDATFHKHAG